MKSKLENHNYHDIDATIIADSKNEHGQRITTFVCTFPRIVLAEFNTHRMLSRNSPSSRAIPFDRMVKDVIEHPFIPIAFQKDHSGMQGNEYLEGSARDQAERMWMESRDRAIDTASSLNKDIQVTKQLANRILEPFKWHTVIVTATEWENFFALRAHEAAEIHIQKLAHIMLDEYNASEPKQLKAGEWHIPFGDNMNMARVNMVTKEFEDGSKLSTIIAPGYDGSKEEIEEWSQLRKVKIATARCARVSYENFEGGDDYEKDINLHDRLASMGHWSPFEHCARSMSSEESQQWVVRTPKKTQYGWCGNFRGFIQLRKLYENENKNDPRIL